MVIALLPSPKTDHPNTYIHSLTHSLESECMQMVQKLILTYATPLSHTCRHFLRTSANDESEWTPPETRQTRRAEGLHGEWPPRQRAPTRRFNPDIINSKQQQQQQLSTNKKTGNGRELRARSTQAESPTQAETLLLVPTDDPTRESSCPAAT